MYLNTVYNKKKTIYKINKCKHNYVYTLVIEWKRNVFLQTFKTTKFIFTITLHLKDFWPR